MTLAARPDWGPYLQPGERVQWTGQPELAGFLLPLAAFGAFALIAGPFALVLQLVPLGLVAAYARDAYALTDRRVLAFRHPFTRPATVRTLPRASVYAGPQMNRGSRSVVFIAPDRQTVSFRFLSRAVQKHLIAEYPKGGPFPHEGGVK